MKSRSNQIRIVFHDIDGCLNPADGTAFADGEKRGLTLDQSRILESISGAIDRSSIEHVVLTTGRSLADTIFIAKELTTLKLRYLLLEHSAIGYDLVQKVQLDLQAIATSLGAPELRTAYSNLRDVHQAITWYRTTGQAILEDKLGCAVSFIPKDSNLTLRVPEAIAGISILNNLKQILFSTTSIKIENLIFHCSDSYVDVLSKVNKADGVKILLKMLGYLESEATMIGDGPNDLSVFELLGRCFCPSNADSSLKEFCISMGGNVLQEAFGEASIKAFESI